MSETKVCRRLSDALKHEPFFDVVGGCGVDASGGKESCMSTYGVWFYFCPFCGKRIVKHYSAAGWAWWEEGWRGWKEER